MNIKDDFILSQINEGYLVGGSIRDFLITGKHSEDRDIAIKNAEVFAKKMANILDATFIELDSEKKIYRLVLKDKINYLDISEIQGETIENDLNRRDFTINAIAYDLKNEKYIDTVNGIEDLKNKKIKHIKDSNFADDPLRILRAFRFLSTTGFELSEDTKTALNKYKHLFLNPAKERINYEIMKLFGGNYTSKALLEMDNFGLLEELFGCVKEMKKVPPNTHHHLDLFHHVVETVRNIEELYSHAGEKEKLHLNSIDFGGFPRLNHIKLAGFLHDIGKFSTWTIEETGRHRFIKHDDVGAKMCQPLLKDLKFSKKQIEYISSMIKNHIYPSNVVASPDLSEKIMMRYIRKMEDNIIDNIILAKADRLSARGEAITEEIVNANLNGLDKLLNFYLEKKETLKPLPKLLDGYEIMEIKNLKQSPMLGEIINAFKEAQINGDINTKEEAVEFVKAY
ncbi:CCA tRNA nucleotidyltransferase [bacterium]|nr:CCA tRNA nucleotidyltransferase [bacterium]